ncbi:unnamed protein product [Ceutorhynchus assimilis]|uniref:Zinc finger CCCH domain-containing protein 3 n=1 Tax=Ceutorhynchus assimilis TaxID=467358 RepID=A0A9N9MF84_9CUCU|nr:unnamed protein product [Ceutorhynchus assimilis]
MYNNNNAPYGYPQYGAHSHYNQEAPQIPKTNRLIYVKKLPQVPSQQQVPSQRILFNPKFMANKVFVNPNFNKQKAAATIHINPRVHINPKNVPKCLNQQIIDLKPQNVPIANSEANQQIIDLKTHNICIGSSAGLAGASKHIPFVLTKTKLIRVPPNTDKKPRRRSVNSKYKIVKSGIGKLTPKNKFKIDKRKSLVPKNNLLNLSALVKSTIIKKSASSVVNINGRIYKKSKNSLRRASIGSIKEQPKKINISKSQYKLVNKSIRNNVGERKISQSKYKLINSENNNLIGEKRKILQSHYKLINKSIKNVGGTKRNILQSRYKLINKSITSSTKNKNLVVGGKRKILQSHYKLINKSISPYKKNKKLLEMRRFKVVRKQSFKKKKMSERKFRKCNIPCITFRKYGLCKGKDKGKCSLKHDPDQVALCTRFLQGACLKENCLLSHSVLPEKMATCKYYLEGACLKENCPYLHVKISPKAEVCHDFLEGFCEKAVQCDKRHQYLCPEYEKYGKCMKPRCQYPHGKMVRSYLINKTHFAKKCSTSTDLKSKNVDKEVPSKSDEEEKPRYYVENESDSNELITRKENLNVEAVAGSSNLINFVGSKSRPKLGNLSAFIEFSEF